MFCSLNLVADVSVAAADAELARLSSVLNDSIDIPSWALIIVCCNPLPPLKHIPMFGLLVLVLILLILKIADGF